MPIKLFFFLLFLFGISELRAQTNFLRGYYVTREKDTVRGYIGYRSETRNYSVCVYKTNPDSKPIRFYPGDISAFVIEDKSFYESHALKKKKAEGYGFFKVIIRGKLSLLRNQSRYFAKNDMNEVYEITARSVITDGKSKTDYSGLGMLKVLMRDCNEITGAFIEKQYLSHADFVPLFVKYNECAGSQVYRPEEIRIKPHFAFGVLAAPTVTRLNLSTFSQNVDLGTKVSGSFGCFTSIFIPKIDENVRLVIEASYGANDHYTYFSFGNTNNDLFIKYSFVKVPVFIRYSYNKVFFDVGIQNQFVLNQNLRWRVEDVQQSAAFTSDLPIGPISKSNTGYLVGAGVKYTFSDFVFRSSLRLSQNIASDYPNKIVSQSLELVLSIQLTK